MDWFNSQAMGTIEVNRSVSVGFGCTASAKARMQQSKVNKSTKKHIMLVAYFKYRQIHEKLFLKAV